MRISLGLANTVLILRSSSWSVEEEILGRVRPSVKLRLLSFPIGANDYEYVAACLVSEGLLGAALFRVKRGALDFTNQALKVSVDYEGRFKLLVVVLKADFVIFSEG